MGSQVWVVATLLVSIVLIVLTIVKLKFHPFLALLLASFFVGATLNETFKYYTTATFIASVLALGGIFLLSFII